MRKEILSPAATAADPVELTGPGLESEDMIRDHLLGLFISAVIVAHGGRYSASHVHRWLGVLAGYLASNTPSFFRAPRVIGGQVLSGTDLILPQLRAAGKRRTHGVMAVAHSRHLAWPGLVPANPVCHIHSR